MKRAQEIACEANFRDVNFLKEQMALVAHVLQKKLGDVLSISPTITKDPDKTCHFSWKVFLGESMEDAKVSHVAVGKVRIILLGETASGAPSAISVRHVNRSGEETTLTFMCREWYRRHQRKLTK